jgi:hypothetical protein
MQVPWWFVRLLRLYIRERASRYHRKCFVGSIADHPALKLDKLSVELFDGHKSVGLLVTCHCHVFYPLRGG